MRKKIKKTKVSITYFEKKIDVPLGVIKMQEMCVRVRSGAHVCVCVCVCVAVSGPRVTQLLLLDPTQVESKKSSQIQWPVPSINAEPVDIFLGEESIRKLWLK